MGIRHMLALCVLLLQSCMTRCHPLSERVRMVGRRPFKRSGSAGGSDLCKEDLCEYAYKCGEGNCCYPPSKKEECGGTCFPSTARVSLENGKSVAMSELRVGDRVQTDGTLTYSRVEAFLMKKYSSASTYKSFSTSLNNTITLSGNHLIYARKGSIDKFNPMYADDVSLGDEVLVDATDGLTTATVLDSYSSVMQGAFVPLTKEGNIMVDGVLASCYASFDHDLAHNMMTPMQWFPEIFGWMFGDENGSAGFVEVTKQLGRWILPLQSLYTKLT